MSPGPLHCRRRSTFACGRFVAAFFPVLLGGCAATPTADSLRHGLVVDLRIGSGVAPATLPRVARVLHTDTATPLSLWLFAADAGSATPRPGVTVELDVLDAAGTPTQAAVVQPSRLRTDARGYAAPVTFLASHSGEFVVRATYHDAGRAVSAYSVRVRARTPTP